MGFLNLLIIDGASRLKAIKDIGYLNTINQVDLMDMYTALPTTREKHTFYFSSTHRLFAKIGHIQGLKNISIKLKGFK